MFIKLDKSSEEMRHSARSILYSDVSKEAGYTVPLLCEKNENNINTTEIPVASR